MEKNLLSDTDYTKGWDNRYGVTAVVGRVSKIEVSEKGANVRVIMPDRLDHQDQPLISKPIPVMQIASNAKKSFAVPRLDDNVLLLKLPNGTSNYMVVGSYYTSKKPPPVTDPMLDYVEYDDGSTMQFDASNGNLDWDLTGDIKVHNEGDKDLSTDGDVQIENDGDYAQVVEGDQQYDTGGDVRRTADGVYVLAADGVGIGANNEILIQAPLIHIVGNILHDGDMVTRGVHQDNNGYHTGGAMAPTVEANTEEWDWTTKLTDASRAGEVGLDATSWAAASEVHLSMISANSRDMTTAFGALFITGNELLLQAAADSTRFGRFMITGNGVGTGGWWTFPVSLLDSNGAPPANNAATTVTVIQRTDAVSAMAAKVAALERRVAELEARR
jgi:phage baseplate assembly protein gpV